MLGLAAIPAIVRFIAFFFLPESPRWLVGRGRKKAAQTVLERLRKGQPAEEVEKELMEIEENLEQSAQENSQSKFHLHSMHCGCMPWCWSCCCASAMTLHVCASVK